MQKSNNHNNQKSKTNTQRSEQKEKTNQWKEKTQCAEKCKRLKLLYKLMNIINTDEELEDVLKESTGIDQEAILKEVQRTKYKRKAEIVDTTAHKSQ